MARIEGKLGAVYSWVLILLGIRASHPSRTLAGPRGDTETGLEDACGGDPRFVRATLSQPNPKNLRRARPASPNCAPVDAGLLHCASTKRHKHKKVAKTLKGAPFVVKLSYMKEENIKLQRIRKISALGDFELALSAADFLQEADEDKRYSHIELRRFRCYEQTAIISYSRPFVPARGSKVPNLTLRVCGLSLSAQERELHETVLSLRNKLVAHSDYEMMNFAAKTHDLAMPDAQPFHVVFAKHDEGLQFYKWGAQLKLIDLIRTVSASLYKELLEEARIDPAAFNMVIHYPNQ